MCIDEFNGDNFDHGPHGFVGGGYVGQVQTNGRPIETIPVPPGTPRWGAQWRRLPHAEDVSRRRQVIRGAARLHAAGLGRARHHQRPRTAGQLVGQDISTYLKTGHNSKAAAAGPMGEVVELSTSNMTDGDVKAIAAYLKDVSGPAPASDTSADKSVLAAGVAMYQISVPPATNPTARACRT